MKKIAVFSFIPFLVFAMTACQGGEKAYKYEAYKKMLSKRDFNPKETKVHVDVDSNGEKSSYDLTYDDVSGRWIGTVIEEFEGEEIEMTSYEALNIIPLVSTLTTSASFMNLEVDQAYKLYASKSDYRIVVDFNYKDEKHEGELKFNADGLCTYNYSSTKDKDGKIINEETKTMTYSLQDLSRSTELTIKSIIKVG